MAHVSDLRHVDDVLRSVSGNTRVTADQEIATSWSRCAKDYRLDPARPYVPTVLSASELRERRAQNEELVTIATAEMNLLCDQISGSGYALLLTDASGVILRERVDPTLRDSFRRAGLLAGADWSEQTEGTNGIGTCIAENRSVIVHREEHFHCNHVSLSCSGTPIRDPLDRIIGVLDASCVSSNDTRVSQMHTMALVKMSAYVIEKRLFLRRHRHLAIVRFHFRPELVNVHHDGALAVAEDGTIVAADRAAVTLLDAAGRHELRGSTIEQLFDARLEDLLGHAASAGSMLLSARDRRQGRRYFLSLNFPIVAASPLRRSRVRSQSDIVQIAPAPSAAELTLEELAGDDPQMLRQARQAQRIADSGVSVIIHGPTGCGKEVFARALHAASSRADRLFVAVNCGAIPESLIESELFGYKFGAFTGSRREGMKGRILQASGGTLFLDEIGDMPMAMQTRLLRVLEARKVEPLGSEVSIDVDLHVVAASHRNLRQLIERNLFREDLYYRLNGLTIELPALAARSDREQVIRGVLASESQGGRCAAISADALNLLMIHSWPGNVRELRNVIRTALALSEGGVVRVEDLPSEIRERSATVAIAAEKPQNSLAQAEKSVLLQVIQDNRWNMTSVARQLGMSRTTLYRKIRQHGIQLPSAAPPAVTNS
jgi:transcriptional regulator of acetoin/glycerol metabolism